MKILESSILWRDGLVLALSSCFISGFSHAASAETPFPIIPRSVKQAVDEGSGNDSFLPCLYDEKISWIHSGLSNHKVQEGMKLYRLCSWKEAANCFLEAAEKTASNDSKESKSIALALEGNALYMQSVYGGDSVLLPPRKNADPELMRKALKAWEEVLRLHPDCAMLYRNCSLAQAYLNHQKALELDFKALKLAPREPRVLIVAADHFEHAGLYREEDLATEAAIAICPQSEKFNYYRATSLLFLGKYAESIPFFNAVIAKQSKIAQVYHERGAALSQIGRYREAISDLNQAISLRPDESEFYSTRALLKSVCGDSKGALADIQHAIKLAPNFPHYHVTMAWFLCENRQYKESIAEADRALALGVSHSTIYHCKAISLFNLGQLKEALKNADLALKLAPQNVGALTLRGQIFEKQGSLEQALADFYSARIIVARESVGPKVTTMKMGQASACGFNDYEQIKERSRIAAELSGNGSPVSKGLIANSLKTYDRLIKLNGGRPESYFERGVINMTGSNYSSAVSDFEKMKTMHAEGDMSSTAVLLESVCLEQLNQHGKANKILSAESTASIKSAHLQAIHEFLLGKLNQDQLLSRARNDVERMMDCYYIGMKHRQSGDAAGAKIFLRKVLDGKMFEKDEFQLAVAALNELPH